MKLVRKVFPTVTQRAAENLGIFIFALVLHTYAIGSVPPTRHIFEWWVEGIFPVLDKSWHEISLEFVRFHHNDSNANVNSPPWILLVALTRKLFDNPLLGYRIPSTFFSAVAPVLLAEIVRRFYRRDMALFAGLLLATTQNLMHFGRIGGYIAPTTTLLLGLMLCTMSIVWERNRKAWLA